MIHKNKTSINVRTRSGEAKVLDEVLFIGTLGVNCVRYTRKCIETVQTDCKKVHFAYFDNGSNETSIADIMTWDRKLNADIDAFHTQILGSNTGVGPGWNALIKFAIELGATKILICNNDIQFGPHTIDGLVEAFNQMRKHQPRTVMVTATNHTKNPAQLKTIRQEWKYQEHPDFSCFMIDPETFGMMGEFSECYMPAFFEDNDMHHRILLSGYKAYGTDWAPYSHIASRTRFENPDIVPHLRFRENKIKFYRNLLTDTVDQEVANKRYQHWLASHPDQPHPNYRDVIDFCCQTEFISASLQTWLDNLTPSNVPN